MQTKIKKDDPLLLVVFALIVICSSCKKENNPPLTTDNNNTTPTIPTTTTTIITATEYGTLMFHLHTYIEDQEVDAYHIAYTTDAGRQLSLSLAQLYISEIQLEKQDGTFYSVSDKKIIKVLDADAYAIGNVPVGHYKSVSFKIGLPPATNSENPSGSPDSLILNHREMWFSNTAQPDGYIFMNVQGTIDTSSDLSGKMCPFVYKIGTTTNYKQITMPVNNFTIIANQAQFIHMIIDYNYLFAGIPLDADHLNINTANDNRLPLAGKIANNIPLMWRCEN